MRPFESAVACARRVASNCRCPAYMLALNKKWLAVELDKTDPIMYAVRFYNANIIALGEKIELSNPIGD